MEWIVNNAQHLVVPLALIAAAYAVLMGRRVRRNRRLGQPKPDKALIVGGVLLALITCVVIGITISHIS